MFFTCQRSKLYHIIHKKANGGSRLPGLLQRERSDAEVAQLVVVGFPVGDEVAFGLGAPGGLEVGLGALVDRDLGVLPLREALGILGERAACGFR